jgi:hypothetical protein
MTSPFTVPVVVARDVTPCVFMLKDGRRYQGEMRYPAHFAVLPVVYRGRRGQASFERVDIVGGWHYYKQAPGRFRAALTNVPDGWTEF